jgi:hypothetical protein
MYIINSQELENFLFYEFCFLSLYHWYLQRSQSFLLASLIFLYLDMRHLLPKLPNQRVHLNTGEWGQELFALPYPLTF